MGTLVTGYFVRAAADASGERGTFFDHHLVDGGGYLDMGYGGQERNLTIHVPDSRTAWQLSMAMGQLAEAMEARERALVEEYGSGRTPEAPPQGNGFVDVPLPL